MLVTINNSNKEISDILVIQNSIFKESIGFISSISSDLKESMLVAPPLYLHQYGVKSGAWSENWHDGFDFYSVGVSTSHISISTTKNFALTNGEGAGNDEIVLETGQYNRISFQARYGAPWSGTDRKISWWLGGELIGYVNIQPYYENYGSFEMSIPSDLSGQLVIGHNYSLRRIYLRNVLLYNVDV